MAIADRPKRSTDRPPARNRASHSVDLHPKCQDWLGYILHALLTHGLEGKGELLLHLLRHFA
jgi:hypothetical protein